MFPSLGNRLLELTHIPHGVTVLTVQCGYDGFGRLDFGDEMFDAVLCIHPPFGDWSDASSRLREWRRMARAGGVAGFAGYGQNAFQPLAAMFEARMQRYGVGVGVAKLIQSYSWRLGDAEACRDLLREAGFENIEVRVEQLGFYLRSADEWWDIVSNSGLRGAISKLPPDQLARFKVEHFAEISALSPSSGNGIWLDVPAIFAVGRVVNFETLQ